MPQERPTFETTAGTYVSEEIIGEGGTSVVHSVTDAEGRRWALKCLKPEQATSDRVRRFLNELHFCRNSQHQNVIKVVDDGFVARRDKKCPFYVMPLYESSLRPQIERGIAPDKVLTRFSGILNGVEAAHLFGVVHRDLKPENVLSDPAGSLVVSDFGIAHFNSELILTMIETKPHDRLANVQYAAPEQLRRGASVDKRADIYALGLILNEMFTRHVPRGAGFVQIAGVAPQFAYLDDLVESMIQQDADKRPSSVDEIKRLLIARRNDFIERQRLDELKKTIVPTSAASHPFFENPPRAVDIDVEPRAAQLTIILDKPLPAEWITAFQTPRTMEFIRGTGPSDWVFNNGRDYARATVRMHPHDLQQHESTQTIIDNFKSYVEFANMKFRENLQRAAQAEEARARKAQQDEIALEEERRRLRERLKI